MTTILACIFLSNRQEISVASTPAVVCSANGVQVHVQPGTDSEIMRYNDEQIWLPYGTKISVLTMRESWYHISFEYEREVLKGYVDSTEVKVNEVNVATEVSAQISKKRVYVHEKAGVESKILSQGGEPVHLGKSKQVVIRKEEMADKEKWYEISFTYNKEVMSGYILASCAKIYISDEICAAIRSAEMIFLREEPGYIGKPVVVGYGNVVKLYDTQTVFIRKEVLANGNYWYRVSVEYLGEKYDGYVPAKKVRFGEIEMVNIPVETLRPTPTMEPTPVPTATPTNAPETNKNKKKDKTQVTEAPKAMSMKKFKKYLKEQGFPKDYQEALIEIHKEYPYWIFNAYHTGIEWSTAIEEESVIGLNLITNSRSSGYKSKAAGAYDKATDTYKAFDGSTWVAVSTQAVAYYMDPRNFLNSTDVFIFESQEYQEGSQTKEGVEEALYNTPMYKTKFTYEDEKGEKKEMYYSDAFMQAAAASRVNPYHLVARVKQEVVTGVSSFSVAASGNASGYKGIYNFYNIGATHGANAAYNGLRYAANEGEYNRPWNNPLKAIVGGAQFLGETYVSRGQNTLYLQKFNVTPGGNFTHQYMANIEAPVSEAKKSVTAYGNTRNEMNLVFSIPVYKNMPKHPCSAPSSGLNGNNYLSGLAVQGYSLSPSFKKGDDGNEVYKVTVENKVKSVRVQASAVNDKAKIKGTGKHALKVGENEIVIRVTAEDGSVRNYKIQVIRQDKNEKGKEKSTPKPETTAKATKEPEKNQDILNTKEPVEEEEPETNETEESLQEESDDKE